MTNPDTVGTVGVDTDQDGNPEVTVDMKGDDVKVGVDMDSNGTPELTLEGNKATVLKWLIGIGLAVATGVGIAYCMGWI